MKLTFLGTNGWYAAHGGNTLCTLLETKEYYLVFDAGDGLHKLGQYIVDERKPVFLLLSHLHFDHIVGLHTLAKLKFKNEMKIFCPKGTKDDLDKIVRQPFSMPLSDLEIKVSIQELEEGIHQLPFHLECRRIFHSDICFGYSVILDGRKLTHLCDTGFCENANLLAQDSDVMVIESSMKDGISNNSWGHLSSVGAAMIARDAKVKKMILTHFDASKFLSRNDREEAVLKAREIFENTIMAEEDLSVEV